MDRPAAPGVVVPVRLPANGRPLYLLVPDPFAASIEPGDRLVIETDIGIVLAEVGCPTGVETRWPQGTTQGMRVIRVATAEDLALRRRQQEREIDAFRVGIMKVRERGLPMKLARVEQLFDGSRLVFYFTAEGRVDFRELVRELASEFHTRIEMRQVGVRDEAKMLGGYGSCGRPLCCTTWLHGFEPVSIRMAKQQDLSLNPAKLSGLCGRLKCCLRYELPPGAARAGRAAKDERVEENGDELPPDEGAGGR